MAKKKVSHSRFHLPRELANIIAGVFLLFLTFLVFSWDSSSLIGGPIELAGLYLFGSHYVFIFSPIIGLLGFLIAIQRLTWSPLRFIGLVLYFISINSLLGFYVPESPRPLFDCSGFMLVLFGDVSAQFAFVAFFLASLYLIFRISYRRIFANIHASLPSINTVKDVMRDLRGTPDKSEVKKSVKIDAIETSFKQKAQELEDQIRLLQKKRDKDAPNVSSWSSLSDKKVPILKKDTPKKIEILEKSPVADTKKISSETSDVTAQPKEKIKIQFPAWDFPKSDLLNHIEQKDMTDPSYVEQMSMMIQKTLLQFRIDVTMVGSTVGPTVIQYRLKPAEGIKLTKIVSLKDDLTLALKAKSIRIQAPIPGLGLVGIEVPNEQRRIVGIRELIESREFRNHSSSVALVVGKNINGDSVIADLAKMPHLLIAWSTNSGKSVCVNSFLISLLYRNTPDQLRMIMIDPKRIELFPYNGIPHLLTPVISDPDKALNSLKWCVAEMERRYSILERVWSRNIDEFNAKVSKPERLPKIVIIIDELADFMMSGNKKEVETTIARIAQKARAIGMHLIVATQRPSVDVITGLIKANIPSRISFTVASQVDSRTILDRVGAEDLLGRGDMLYSPIGVLDPDRIQWVLVTTEEVESVVNHVKLTIDPTMLEEIYDRSIIEWEKDNFDGSVMSGEYEEDPKIVEEAIRVVRENGKASTSMLQRRMKLGYARAARVIDILEELGVVGPADGSKPREVIQ